MHPSALGAGIQFGFGRRQFRDRVIQRLQTHEQQFTYPAGIVVSNPRLAPGNLLGGLDGEGRVGTNPVAWLTALDVRGAKQRPPSRSLPKSGKGGAPPCQLIQGRGEHLALVVSWGEFFEVDEVCHQVERDLGTDVGDLQGAQGQA